MYTTTRPSLWKYFILCLTKKYCAFSGTAPRREFWGFFLFKPLFVFVGVFIVTVGLSAWVALAAMQAPEQMSVILFTQIALLEIALLVLYLPTLGVTIRRLRDAGFNTAWGYGYLGLDWAWTSLFSLTGPSWSASCIQREPRRYSWVSFLPPTG